MLYLLDTNTCIYIIKRSPSHVLRRFQRLRVGDVGVSAITHCELQVGVSKSSKPRQNQAALAEFLAPLEVLDFPSTAAPLYGGTRARLQRAGTLIGNYDLLIAAHCLHLGIVLVTNNTKDFDRVPELRVESWVEPLVG